GGWNASPSAKVQPSRRTRASATVDFPEPETPISTTVTVSDAERGEDAGDGAGRAIAPSCPTASPRRRYASAGIGLEPAHAELVPFGVAHPHPERSGLLQRLVVDPPGAERGQPVHLVGDVRRVHVQVHAVLPGALL